MNNKKKDLINITIIILFILVYVTLVTKFFSSFYGSTIDWDCQHWIIPDYFRKLFYSTHNLFNNFALNIGDGQNIYYLSYYGYLSPIVLLSYLLPFVPMRIYIEAISIVGLIVSCCLFYHWISKKHNCKYPLIISLLFVSASPMLIQSHRHIMFISYMPFLLLSLIEIDNIFEKKQFNINYKLILYMFLLIMSNYFFAVSGLFSISIYELYKLFNLYNKNNKNVVKKEVISYAASIIISIMMASVLLIPTVSVILNGRASSNVGISLINLLIPNIKISKIFYGPYSSGITLFTFFATVFCIKDKKIRPLSIILIISLLFPFICYCLNGTMYIDHKVYIPLLPLFMLVLSVFIENIKIITKNSLSLLIVIALFSCLLVMKNINDYLIYVVIIELLIFVYITFNNKKEKKVLIPLVMIIICSTIVNLNTDKLMNKDTNIMDKIDVPTVDNFYNYRITTNQKILQNINNVENINYNIGTIYSSVENKNYRDYYYNFGVEVSQRSYGKISYTDNILFNIANGNKYIVSNREIFGYKKIENYQNVYENENVLTIARSNLRKMNRSTYEKLEYPYNMEALLKYVITEDSQEDNYETIIDEYSGLIYINNQKVIDYRNLNDKKYDFGSDKSDKLNIKLDNLKNDDIVLINFDVEQLKDNKNDISININNMKNLVSIKNWKYYNRNNSFHYAIPNDKSEFLIKISKGHYTISNIKIYVINYNELIDSIKFINKIDLNIDNNRNILYGEYYSEKEDVVYLQIPFDKGFSIKNNEKEADYYLVNNGMIGFKVEKGNNNFKIEYKAPLLKESKLITIIGFLIFGLTIFLSKKKKKLLIIKKK